MVWIYKVLQIAEHDLPTGRYRFTKVSDEDGGGPYALCKCLHGHKTPEEARNCKEASDAYEREIGV